MTRDELEFSITEYLDGTLDEATARALEARLANDAGARAMLEEHRALTVMLRSQPVPEVGWERLAQSISEAIDRQAEQRMARISWILRARTQGYIAVAASVVLAGALAVHFLQTPRGSTIPINPQPPVALVVQGPQEDQPQGPAVEEVSIGPGGSYAHASSIAPYADEMDTRPTRVALAAAAPVAAEESSQPSPF
jgi:anti-sigma-K factor RskA